ncbi:MAG: LemA family protein [Sphingobacteriales bacterium]|nr:LemA family protein [Sphingobacteriales bacterium]
MIAGVVILFAIIFIGWANSVYNKAIDLQEQVDARWGDVQTSYQRRADLVPNLVETVKGAAENELKILSTVTEARAGISRAKTPGEVEMFGKQINSAINLAFEAYPQIRSTENFKELQAQLEGTENRISVARMKYNEAVQQYNRHIRGKFRKMALNIFASEDDNFVRREMFEAEKGAEKAPEVKF